MECRGVGRRLCCVCAMNSLCHHLSRPDFLLNTKSQTTLNALLSLYYSALEDMARTHNKNVWFEATVLFPWTWLGDACGSLETFVLSRSTAEAVWGCVGELHQSTSRRFQLPTFQSIYPKPSLVCYVSDIARRFFSLFIPIFLFLFLQIPKKRMS